MNIGSVKTSALCVLFLLLGVWGGWTLATGQERSIPARDENVMKWQGQRHLEPSGSEEVSCPTDPITVLVLGQSNAANSVGERFVSAHTFDRLAGKCYRAAGPTLGSSGKSGSIWPLVGDRVHQATGRAVVVVGMAISGTSVSEWVQQTEARGYVAVQLHKLRDVPIDFVVWHQGEADFATPPADYERSLRTVTGRVRDIFPKARILVAQTSLCAEHPPRAELRAAQAAVVDGKAVLPGPNTDTLSGFDDRYDGCHFTGSGARKVAESWAASLLSGLGS